MKEVLKIVCPSCSAANRVEKARLADRPRCGRCKQELFLSHPVDLNSANFERTLTQNEIPVVIEFWAPWCGYCKQMSPVFQQAAAELEPHFRLGKVNTEAEPAISGRLGVQGIPTTIIFKNGQEVARQSGAMNLGNLLRWVRSYA